jgi:hypothetical protein
VGEGSFRDIGVVGTAWEAQPEGGAALGHDIVGVGEVAAEGGQESFEAGLQRHGYLS